MYSIFQSSKRITKPLAIPTIQFTKDYKNGFSNCNETQQLLVVAETFNFFVATRFLFFLLKKLFVL